jgi:hypothetical protein
VFGSTDRLFAHKTLLLVNIKPGSRNPQQAAARAIPLPLLLLGTLLCYKMLVISERIFSCLGLMIQAIMA